ncbi:hypothetical protein [Sinomonas gamaensis]|uniref:hypothetical protein n=1 Tax=Sinomonas gamaensis TaxID=2565624 RepID=UPI001486A3D0|nr:hypothetical protein [Sinomonas gamaensis]
MIVFPLRRTVGLSPTDGHQRSPGVDRGRGPLLDVASHDIEDQVDAADSVERIVVEVEELVRSEVERLLTVARPVPRRSSIQPSHPGQ